MFLRELDSSHIICHTITCILINVNKKNIVNYESQNIYLFTTSTLFTASVMSNMVLLNVTICHFDVLSFNFFRVCIAFGMGGVRFDSQAVQIGHSVVYGSPPLQRFSSVVRSCVGQALTRGPEPAIFFT